MRKYKLREILEGNLFTDGDWIESKDQDPNGKIRLIQLADIGDGYFIDKSSRYINSETARKLKCTFLSKGDVLVARMPDPLGRATVFPLKGERQYITAVDVCIIRPPDHCESKYIMYAINSSKVRLEIGRQSTGTTRKRISRKKLGEISIPLPPLTTQKRIATILDDAQALKQKNEQLLKEYDELAQSIFLDMFGDPVTNPKGWEVKTIEDVSENRDSNRVPIKKDDRANIQGIYPYYGATGIVDFINDFKFEGEYLLIAEDGKNLVNRKKPIAWLAKGKFWVNNHAHVVEYNGRANLTFLSFQLNNIDISKFITGIDQFKLNRGNLNRISVYVPPLKLQNQFAEKIKLIEQQKELAKKELKESKDLFQALLQKAFNNTLNV